MRYFYRVHSYNSNLNYDKYFKDGSTNRNLLTEFNSNNTDLMDVEQVKRKLLELDEIQTAIRDMVADEEL